MPVVHHAHRAVAARSIVATLAILAPLSPAAAAPGQGAGIDLQAFRPAMDSRGFVTVDGADTLGPRQVSLGLVTTWADGVLHLDGPDGASYAVDTLVSPTLLAAVGLRPLGVPIELGVALPFGIMAGDRGPDSDGATASPNDDQRYHLGGQGIGNLGLRAKLRLRSPSRGPIGVALLAAVWAPTATTRDSWLADDVTVVEGRLIAERARRRWRMAASIGLRAAVGGDDPVFRDVMTGAALAPPATGASVAGGGDAIVFGAAASLAIDPERFELVGEIFGARPVDRRRGGGDGGGDRDQIVRPLEALAGIKVYLASSSFLTLGAGAGLVPGAAGSPDARAFLGIVFEPRSAAHRRDDLAVDEACEVDPMDGFERDRCPRHADDRGSPDADGDGLRDDLDRCLHDAEDRDGFEDADGCPEPDNDRDRILDVDDLCPDAAEDRDGFEDADGCPEPDNDHDQIPDRDDRCPLEPETYDGIDDDDGCADGRSLTFDGDSLVLDNVYFEFDSAVIAERSHPILRAVARTILANPDLARLEVQGHTDERGADGYNLALSQARAEAVRGFLIEAGVDAARLDARGYGERAPVVRGHGPAAWARNRRVEFVIVARAGDRR